MGDKFTNSERLAAMKKLPGWTKVRGKEAIQKTFTFTSFSAAFAWMTKIALRAEQLNHHPEWFNVYNSVTVTLTTHDVGGLSQLDVDMASYMNKTAGSAGKPKK
ncbi:MAG: 4a-hydroxytetrahydrobiopterin dehydratase [Parvibaculales bacterium]